MNERRLEMIRASLADTPNWYCTESPQQMLFSLFHSKFPQSPPLEGRTSWDSCVRLAVLKGARQVILSGGRYAKVICNLSHFQGQGNTAERRFRHQATNY